MDDQVQENIRKLLPYRNKKIVWTGFDPETQAYSILFDDQTGFHITGDVMPINDVKEFIDTTLVENKLIAMQILALETLYPEAEKVQPDQPAEIKADAADGQP